DPASPANLGPRGRCDAVASARRGACLGDTAMEAATCGPARAVLRRTAGRVCVSCLSNAAALVRRRNDRREPYTALQRDARADSRGGDAAKKGARAAGAD